MGEFIFQGGLQAVAEVVDRALGSLGGDFEFLSQRGGIGKSLPTGLLIEPDKPLQVQLIAHAPSCRRLFH